MKVVPPLRRFRVYPEKRALYWVVELYPDRRSMHIACAIELQQLKRILKKGEKLPKHMRDYTARVCASSITKFRHKKARTSPRLGVMYFHFPKNGSVVLAHEAAHATRYYFVRLGVSIDDPASDERFARILGELVAAISRRIW